MAKDSKSGLYLPLSIDLNEWNASLLAVDESLQKKMRELKDAKVKLKLDYDLKINELRSAGKEEEALAAELAKVNQQYEIQAQVLQGLKKAYDDVDQTTAKGKNRANYLAKQIETQTREYEKLGVAIDKVKAKQSKYLETKFQSEKDRTALSYDVKIAGADEAGKTTAKMSLEMQKLNALAQIQKKHLTAIEQAYKAEVKASGESSEASLRLRDAWRKEQIQLFSLQKQLNDYSKGFGERILSGLDSTFPKFASFRQNLKEVTDAFRVSGAEANQFVNSAKSISPALGSIAKQALTIAPALGAVAASITAVVAAGVGIEKMSDSLDESADKASDLNEELFALKENFNLTNEEASHFYGIMRMDGTNADAFATALRKITKELQDGSEKGKMMSAMLEHYGVSAFDASGNIKNIDELTRELANGFQNAKKAGDELAYVNELFGARGGQFTHFLNGYEQYDALLAEINPKMKILIDYMHDLQTVRNQTKYASELAEQAEGQSLISKRIKTLQQETEEYKEQIKWQREHASLYEKINANYEKWDAMMAQIAKTANELGRILKASVVYALSSIGDKVAWVTGKFASMNAKILDFAGFEEKAQQLRDFVKELESTAKAELVNPSADDGKKYEKFNRERIKQEEEANKKAEEANKKKFEANMKIYEDMLSLNQTAFEKEITAIEKERDAYIQLGADKEAAESLFQQKRKQIEDKYNSSNASEKAKEYEKQVQAAQQAQTQIEAIFQSQTQRRIAEINKQKEAWIKAGADEVEATKAAQKQIADVQIAEAERTLTQQIKIIRKAAEERAKGGNWQERVQQYADQQWMKGRGIKQSDISSLQAIGVDTINKLADSSSRLLAGFAKNAGMGNSNTTNNNTVNINMDNTVVESESAMITLANKVADILIPHIEKATNPATAGNSF